MLLTSKVVEFENDDVSARLVISAANVRQGMVRTMMQRAAKEARDDAPHIALLRQFTWPDIVAATTDGEIQLGDKKRPVYDLTFEEWLELPEPLVISWEGSVYELNPHWLPESMGEVRGRTRSGAKPKSETSSGSASSAGTRAAGAPEKIQ